ncbi:MAG: hypothetical protein HRT70_07980 [Flavobacteriaceae bacterium]|nr:hypothetical protein [Flavobacteriaceae bacterium]
MTQWQLWDVRAKDLGYTLNFVLRFAGICKQTKSNWKRGVCSPNPESEVAVEEAFIRLSLHKVAS